MQTFPGSCAPGTIVQGFQMKLAQPLFCQADSIMKTSVLIEPTMRQTISTPRQGVKRIVLLDDQSCLAAFVEQLLREWFEKFELIHFEDGDDAWKELRRIEPDLFITDWQHPGMDGAEMVARLAKIRAKFPVLMISAHHRADFENLDSSGLKIRYLKKENFMREDFFRTLNDFVGPGDFPELQAQF